MRTGVLPRAAAMKHHMEEQEVWTEEKERGWEEQKGWEELPKVEESTGAVDLSNVTRGRAASRRRRSTGRR